MDLLPEGHMTFGQGPNTFTDKPKLKTENFLENKKFLELMFSFDFSVVRSSFAVTHQ
jgi:hypothetical protein